MVRGKGLKSRILSDPRQPQPAVIVEEHKGACVCSSPASYNAQCPLLRETELLPWLPLPPHPPSPAHCTGGGGVCLFILPFHSLLCKQHSSSGRPSQPLPQEVPTGCSHTHSPHWPLSFLQACSPVNQQTSWDPFPWHKAGLASDSGICRHLFYSLAWV